MIFSPLKYVDCNESNSKINSDSSAVGPAAPRNADEVSETRGFDPRLWPGRVSFRLTSVTPRGLSQDADVINKVAYSTAGITVATYLLPQFASAADEVATLAAVHSTSILVVHLENCFLLKGEPLVVQAGWAALLAIFTMSIAIVVWGRSGL